MFGAPFYTYKQMSKKEVAIGFTNWPKPKLHKDTKEPEELTFARVSLKYGGEAIPKFKCKGQLCFAPSRTEHAEYGKERQKVLNATCDLTA